MRLNFPTGSRPCTRARSSLTIVRAASVPSVVLADGTRIALSKVMMIDSRFNVSKLDSVKKKIY